MLLTYISRVQYNCGIVLVFWFWRIIVFGVTYVLRVDTMQLCGCVSFLVVAGNSVVPGNCSQNMRTSFDFL